LQIFLSALGCRLNEAELELWARLFDQDGHQMVPQAEQADLIVLNSCAVTQEAVRKSRKNINQLRRKNPDATLVVSGCFVSLEDPAGSSSNAEQLGVDLVVHNREKDKLVARCKDFLQKDKAGRSEDPGGFGQIAQPDPGIAARQNPDTEISSSLPERWIPLHTEKQAPAAARESSAANGALSWRRRQRAFIKIQDGCRYRCTYCVVTLARGDEKSRSISELVEEVNALFEKGVHEIVLTGVHVGGYGSDTGESLATLMQSLLADTDIPRIRFASVEPWDLEDALLATLTDGRVMPHMHLPLQSGSDTVLKRMARRCKTDEFSRLVHSLKQAIPGFNVTTDIIAGFPGETDSEWRETLDFVDSLSFGHIHVFPFSERAGTKASRLPNRLSGDIKRERARELRALACEKRFQFLNECVNTSVEVLWEKLEQGKSPAMLQGYTPNYIKVATEIQPGELDLASQWVNRITPLNLTSVVTQVPGQARDLPEYHLEGTPVRQPETSACMN